MLIPQAFLARSIHLRDNPGSYCVFLKGGRAREMGVWGVGRWGMGGGEQEKERERERERNTQKYRARDRQGGERMVSNENDQ